jgi:hypothetical protein
VDARETQAEYDQIWFREDLNRKQDAKNNEAVLITLILQRRRVVLSSEFWFVIADYGEEMDS